jgi:hypothetical protein
MPSRCSAIGITICLAFHVPFPIHSSHWISPGHDEASRSKDSAMSVAQNDLPKEPLPVHAEGRDAPDWELPEQSTSKPTRPRFGRRAVGWAISDRFDRILPPHKRYLGGSRRTLLIFIVALLLFILALVIGLSVGLTKKSKYALWRTHCLRLAIDSSRHRNLPLPDGAKTFNGDLTYYEPGLGACGITSTSEENIVSISHFTFDAVQTGSDPNQNPLCGRKVRAQRVYNGETVSVDMTVVDRCK